MCHKRRAKVVLVLFAAVVGWVPGLREAGADDANQPLASGVARLLQSLDLLGAPLPMPVTESLQRAIRAEDGEAIRRLLDPHVLVHVHVNPELRVKVRRGEAAAVLQQAGYTPVIVRVENEATVTRRVRVQSPQAGPIYSGTSEGSLVRQAQTELGENQNTDQQRRFLELEMYAAAPLSDRLSGHAEEYMLLLILSSEAGAREATLVFDLGQGTQDLGFRSEVPVLFSIRPAIEVPLRVLDVDGQPTTARLEIRDRDGHVYPPQARRLAPDFFFQPQIYREDGDVVRLPPGEFEVTAGRGPEYLQQTIPLTVKEDGSSQLSVQLTRWINPMHAGFWCGDHHIHGAGCSHYDNPTQGVTPADMFRQVAGEGLNVGCVLTWGPCFDHQRTYFSPLADDVSSPQTLLKYDLEISGFGSAAMGHVCLLNLFDQTYPGSEGTSTKGWPTWTVPVMRWAKEQGGITGYPHSALHVDAEQTAEWLVATRDRDRDRQLSQDEATGRLLPERFDVADEDGNGMLTQDELRASADRASQQLPNLAIPALNGGGAMEIFVSTAEGVCDFISAMDTARIPEWNTWYHLLNCGFPLKLSGETDFPCMSSRQVGQGRVYVQLGQPTELDFAEWCRGVAAGRSYVSDGYAHALKFGVDDHVPGEQPLSLAQPGTVQVQATVAFAPEVPVAVAYGTLEPAAGRRMVGDTINLHAPRETRMVQGGERSVELIVNGRVVATSIVPADGQPHDVAFEVDIDRSSWVAVRQFPQLHTNPVDVIVEGQPIRASRASALWCAESVQRLWETRQRFIRSDEREAARDAYTRALAEYLKRAQESPDENLQVPQAVPLQIQEARRSVGRGLGGNEKGRERGRTFAVASAAAAPAGG